MPHRDPAAVEALARVIHDYSPLFGWDALSHDSRYRYRVRAAGILDYLAATLHADTEQGQAIRDALGLSVETCGRLLGECQTCRNERAVMKPDTVHHDGCHIRLVTEWRDADA